VPNVVKTNWARETGLWTPSRRATVVHGDGDTVDAFSDVVVVNYEVLDRHVGWLGSMGFAGWSSTRRTSSRTRAPALAARARAVPADPVAHRAPAADGADRHAADQRHRGLPGHLGVPRLDRPHRARSGADGGARANGFTPLEPDFYPAARTAVIDLGIVRRRKVDVAADIPARRIADLPVELDGALGRSIREAERVLARRS
jgi:hypothetical protein